ncbi:A disintegrin and metalloproteinase with thrombospondin motifs 18 [Amphibalanus amphitrite]|uniref:A disintegrin and metalloproteinase with thrombospondin motifs 18 n=1 Tax=Amphibalanus amphitrite TaxID=1232801 RepID=A0A6A4V2P7_AMPAM|nr:A disintegrin and metalloproteinase with thrombospondin motifs 18-like isoform X1 [Amphibalanus amphitrite]KAF0290567.1 A disintegrin and metalloproteinase with thrombospondin motifs 18 [Amphibalanus amphitrite]
MAHTLSSTLALLSCAAALQASSADELATAASHTAPRHTLHLHLSVDELRHVFAVERHEDVPEYDLFHVSSRRKRSLNGRHRRSVHVQAFGDQIDLDLEMNREIDNHIRLFYADGADSDINIERVEGDTDMYVGEPYQDVSREAALLVNHADDDTLQLNGVVSDLVIAPAPRRVHHHYPSSHDDDALLADDQEPLDGSESHDSTTRLRQRRSTPPVTRGLHVIYKRAASPSSSTGSAPIDHEDSSLLVEKEPAASEDSLTDESPSRNKRSTPSLYPEVLLIVDYQTYEAHNFDAKAVKRYMMTFMNAVDLRYKSAEQPSITIKVAGIVISKSKEATPYLEKHMVNGKALEAVGALDSIGKYLFKEKRLPTYDAAVVITKRDMCTRRNGRGTCNKVTAGYAYVGGGCSISSYHKKVNSVALVEDSTGFSGIIVAAHEIGHLLGAVHDGSPPAAYLGGPGARSCPWKDGYIMSDMRRDHKGLKWSVCSLNQFAHFANDKRSKCMHNHAKKPASLPSAKKLPGKLMTVDAQCKRDRGSSACFKDHRVCAELYCFEPSSGYCVSYRPAAEGSACGRGLHCINGQCVADSFYY